MVCLALSPIILLLPAEEFLLGLAAGSELMAAVLETENSYQNISETNQSEPEDETFANQEIVLKTSQLYGVDLVRHLRLS